MKITHVFPDGTRTPDINGLRVPYTAQTAAAYQAVAAAQHHKKEDKMQRRFVQRSLQAQAQNRIRILHMLQKQQAQQKAAA